MQKTYNTDSFEGLTSTCFLYPNCISRQKTKSEIMFFIGRIKCNQIQTGLNCSVN